MTKAEKDSMTAEYSYGIDNMRRSKTVNGTVKNYLWDGGNIVGETDSDGNITAKYYHGSGITAADMGNGIQWYLSDSHGDVTEFNGTKYSYDAFGNQYMDGEDENPFRYCGEYYDNETGFIYLRNRYYDPSTGRFISEDPVKDGLNWYVYCSSNPLAFVDPWGLDAIVITNENSVNILDVKSAGHTSAIYQDADGNWFYTYWGNKAAAVIRIPDNYVKEWQASGDIAVNSMSSLSNFNGSLNKFLSENGFENITSDYTSATYIVGDFTSSLDAAYDDVNSAYTNKHSKGTLTTLADGSKIFQGHNSPYNVAYRNCFDKTYASLSKGTLADGTNVGTYMKNLGFTGGMIPNNAISKFREVFMNSSFTYKGAQPALSNYASLYEQNSPWARKASKASYANAAIKK